MPDVELLFLGTGTSAGVPMIGCHCAVCESSDPHDKRTRPSVAFSYEGKSVLVDTAPELRLQSVANGLEAIEAVVITHAHADHIMGLDDVRRFNAIRQGPLDVWAEPRAHDVLQRCFGYAFCAPNPDLRVFRPHLTPRVVEGPFEIAGVSWQPIRLFHGALPVLGYRVGHIAYCTDVNAIPEESMGLLEDLDVLVLDGLQWTRHTTHYSLDEAVEVAQRVKAKRTFFTHIAHGLGHAATNAKLPAGMALGHDGLRVKGRL